MTTRCAYASITATSSAVVERTVRRRRRSARRAGPATTLPNAPKRTFAIERFIALPISIVSSVPDAPTSMPLTIRTFECSTKPVAAAASPVNAFSSEITTGMSAPPIGSTNITPKSAATRIIATSPQKLTAGHRPDPERDRRDEDERRSRTAGPGT